MVIGGGLGGLMTGAFLAKEGYEVTVLDKNATAGGGLQTFYRHGVGFETGMHLLGGFREGGSLRRICDYLGMMDKLCIRDIDDDCMDEILYSDDRVRYRIAAGKEGFVKSLARYFPDEAEHLKSYVEELFRLVGELDIFYLRPSKEEIAHHSEHFLWPVDKLIAHYVANPKLRDLLGYMNPMYGGKAGVTPAYIHALISVLYIEGPSRFVGGSQQMERALSGVIASLGGRVEVNAEVARVAVTDRMVEKVVTTRGMEYTADKYISSVHASELLRVTDTGAFTKAYRDRIESIPNTYSIFALFIEFEGESFPYINHTCYYQRDYRHVWCMGDYVEEEWPYGFMYMTPPDTPDEKWARRMIINCIMPYEPVARWADTLTGRRGSDYEAWKERHAEKIIRRMEELYPDFRRCIKRHYTATPLTIRDFYHNKQGAIYGFAKDCNNLMVSQLPVFTKVRNLYLTGQCIGLHGICGVPLSAIVTAEAIVGKNVILNKL